MDFEISDDNLRELSDNYEVDIEVINIFIKMINNSNKVTFQEQFNYILEYCISLISSYQDIFIGELELNSSEYKYPTFNEILSKVICEELGLKNVILARNYDISCKSVFKSEKDKKVYCLK